MNYSPEEIKGFEQQRILLAQKLNSLRQALILQTDAAVVFKLETDIAQAEMQLEDLKRSLSEAWNIASESGQTRLREKVRDLKISEPMGRLHLVNCNRQEVRDRFEAGFEHRKNAGMRNHFYFLSACPTQLPPSLGERMVYELLADLIEEGRETVFIRTDPKNHDRVKLEKLPIGISLEKSQELFREFCAGFFGWTHHQNFEDSLAANRLPLPRHRYTVLPFYLRKKEWKTFFPQYFDWISEQLGKRDPGGPILLVFIVFYHENLHDHFDAATGQISDEKSAGIINALDAICEQHPGAGHFYPLEPVHISDLRDWFADLGEHNPARLQPVETALVEGLPGEELHQFRQSQCLNMDRVELVQELVYAMYNQ
jgi:hypothetical protein